jgi:hypothetical protein
MNTGTWAWGADPWQSPAATLRSGLLQPIKHMFLYPSPLVLLKQKGIFCGSGSESLGHRSYWLRGTLVGRRM